MNGMVQVGPAATVRVRQEAADPEGGPLKVKWVLMADSADYPGGGEEAAPPSFPAAIVHGDLTEGEVRMPQGGGAYRLKYRDTAKGEIELTLTRVWRKHEISLKDKDLHWIKTGFLWSVAGQGKPVTFHLDGVRYQ